MKGKKKKPGVSVTHLPNPHFPTTRLPECSLLTVLTHFSSTSFNCNEAEGREEVVVLASTADMVGGFCGFFSEREDGGRWVRTLSVRAQVVCKVGWEVSGGNDKEERWGSGLRTYFG